MEEAPKSNHSSWTYHQYAALLRLHFMNAEFHIIIIIVGGREKTQQEKILLLGKNQQQQKKDPLRKIKPYFTSHSTRDNSKGLNFKKQNSNLKRRTINVCSLHVVPFMVLYYGFVSRFYEQ